MPVHLDKLNEFNEAARKERQRAKNLKDAEEADRLRKYYEAEAKRAVALKNSDLSYYKQDGLADDAKKQAEFQAERARQLRSS